MTSLKWEYMLSSVFALCSALLLLLMVLLNNYGTNNRAQLLDEIKSVESAGFELQDIPDSSFDAFAIDEYSELVERPLFYKDRRPIVLSDAADEAVEAEKKASVDFTYSLIGIISTPDSVYALFQDPQAKPDESKFKRHKQGDEINGWTIQEIKPDRIIVSTEAGSEEIKLSKPRVHSAAPKKKKPRRTNPFSRKNKKKE